MSDVLWWTTVVLVAGLTLSTVVGAWEAIVEIRERPKRRRRHHAELD